MTKTNKRDGWDGISKEGGGYIATNEGYGLGKPITPKGVSGINSPITAWAVELDGKIYPEDVLPTRAVARYIRNVEARSELVKKATVRKLILQVVPGR